jgi:hypothetical protein
METQQNGIYRGNGKERGRGFAKLLQVDDTVVVTTVEAVGEAAVWSRAWL